MSRSTSRPDMSNARRDAVAEPLWGTRPEIPYSAARGDVLDRAEEVTGRDLSGFLRFAQRDLLMFVSGILQCPLSADEVKGSVDYPTVDGMDGWEWLDAMTMGLGPAVRTKRGPYAASQRHTLPDESCQSTESGEILMTAKITAERVHLVQLDSTGMWRGRDDDGTRVGYWATRSDAVEELTALGYVLTLQNAIGSTWERGVPCANCGERLTATDDPPNCDACHGLRYR